MEHVILVIDGMTCINCQNRIEQKLNNTDGISYAKVFYSQNKAEIDYDPELITLHQIGSMINELGYGVQRNKAERAFEKFKTPVIILLIIILFALLQISGLLNILVPSRLADSQMGYGMLFIVGLLTSVHCVAMCGGINFSQSINSITASKSFAGPLFYNIGRVISYTMIGFLLGLLGMFITGGAGGGIPTVLQGILKITAGVVMIIMGINLLGILPGFRRRMIVESDLELGAYPEITVYRGVPVRWTINVSDDVINGCNYKMILKEYDIIHEFSPGENVIEFTPDQTGSFQYTCWMGMIYGKINVIDKDM